jgi:predicted metal-dependent HD superfamily phosphohydrolase
MNRALPGLYSLQTGWRELWREVSASDGGPVFNTLMWMYEKENRHYHDLKHVHDCIHQYLLYLTKTGDLPLLPLNLGIWFHDVVYTPGATDNESRSAEFARCILEAGGVEDSIIDQTCKIIMATSLYLSDEPSPSFEENLVRDIDLVGFGTDSYHYFVVQNTNIENEFLSVTSKEIYYPRRLAFLESVLKKSRIFITDYFYERFEVRARENISRYLEENKVLR